MYRYGAAEGFTNPGQFCVAFIVGGVMLLRSSLADEKQIFCFTMGAFLLALGIASFPSPLVFSWIYLKLVALPMIAIAFGCVLSDAE